MASEILPSTIRPAFDNTILDNIDRVSTQAENLNMGNNKIVNISTPLNSGDAANKDYVDNYAQGVQWLASVKAKTSAILDGAPVYSNGTNGVGATLTATTGALGEIGGYTVVQGDRILVDTQVEGKHNGIYVATTITDPYVLTRSTDLDGSPTNETKVGTGVYVSNGTYQNTRWVIGTLQSNLSNPPNVVIGTDIMSWVQQGGAANSTQLDAITAAGTLAQNQVYIGGANSTVSRRLFPIREIIKLKFPSTTSGESSIELLDADNNALTNGNLFTVSHGGRVFDNGIQASSTLTLLQNSVIRGVMNFQTDDTLAGTFVRPCDIRVYNGGGVYLRIRSFTFNDSGTGGNNAVMSVVIDNYFPAGDYYFSIEDLSGVYRLTGVIESGEYMIEPF